MKNSWSVVVFFSLFLWNGINKWNAIDISAASVCQTCACHLDKKFIEGLFSRYVFWEWKTSYQNQMFMLYRRCFPSFYNDIHVNVNIFLCNYFLFKQTTLYQRLLIILKCFPVKKKCSYNHYHAQRNPTSLLIFPPLSWHLILLMVIGFGQLHLFIICCFFPF